LRFGDRVCVLLPHGHGGSNGFVMRFFGDSVLGPVVRSAGILRES
jgi:hypothetical protein